jgi:hypothetical protein
MDNETAAALAAVQSVFEQPELHVELGFEPGRSNTSTTARPATPAPSSSTSRARAQAPSGAAVAARCRQARLSRLTKRLDAPNQSCDADWPPHHGGMKAHYAALARYNAWANRQLYDAAAELSDDEYRADRGAFFKSMHGTLNHLLTADQVWMHRFTGQGPSPDRLDMIQHETLADLRARARPRTRASSTTSMA